MQPPILHKFIRKVADIIAEIRTRKDTASSQAEECDLSYEDALFDLQLRSFLRTEYNLQPPSTAFSKLMRSIRVSSVAKKPATRHLALGRSKEAWVALRQGATRLDTVRSLSGGLATLLLVAVMWPNMMHVLNGHLPAAQPGSLVTTTPSQPSPAFAPPQPPTLSTPAVTYPVEVATPLPVQNISPGLMYEQPRLRLAMKLGEDLQISAQTPGNSVQATPQAPSNKQIELQTEPSQPQTCEKNKVCVT